MAAKRFNQESFNIQVGNVVLNFYCWTTSTRNGFCHTVWCYNYDQTTKVSYCNRTWESYRYQTALQSAFRKLRKDERVVCEEWDKKKVNKNHEECEAFISAFKSAHDSLTDSQKEKLAESDIHLETMEQAESLVQGMKMIGALNKLMGAA